MNMKVSVTPTNHVVNNHNDEEHNNDDGTWITSVATVDVDDDDERNVTTTTTMAAVAAAAVPTTPSSSSSSSNNKYSSFLGAVFNFTNCIVGAGAIGLGGAIAESGGIISILAILGFAMLTKQSLDLVMDLSLQQQCGNGGSGGSRRGDGSRTTSYEELGFVAYGRMGWNAVLLSKFCYSFGCLVAYLIVVKDNFASGLQHLLYGSHHHDHHHDPLYTFLSDSSALTMLLSVTVLLPLCLLRDMSPLAHLSMLSVLAMTVIVVIVIYLFLAEPNIRLAGNGVYVNWFQIRPGVLQSLGTFVFTFVSQHTVHLTFQSMRPELRTLQTWKRVSLYSLSIATHISLAVGLVVYMTFWQASRSDLFIMYPMMRVIDVAKLILCMTMLWTFPLPFFTCREVLIVVALCPPDYDNDDDVDDGNTNNSPDERAERRLQPSMTIENDAALLREPLLSERDGNDILVLSTTPASEGPPLASSTANHAHLRMSDAPSRFLLPGKDRQLVLVYHVLVTVIMWALTTILAIVAPSLGDVLNLVGCATGTLIAFLLPALISFRLQGYTHLAMLILVVGGAVGLIGTWFSLRKILFGA